MVDRWYNTHTIYKWEGWESSESFAGASSPVFNYLYLASTTNNNSRFPFPLIAVETASCRLHAYRKRVHIKKKLLLVRSKRCGDVQVLSNSSTSWRRQRIKKEKIAKPIQNHMTRRSLNQQDGVFPTPAFDLLSSYRFHTFSSL